MTLLIAVKSCKKAADSGCHDAIRNTWGKHTAAADLRFFIGDHRPDGAFSSTNGEDDCQSVDAPDDYDGLPFKSRAIVRWFLEREYDHVFLCDTDTFVIPERLLSCGFQGYDYAGRFCFLRKQALGTTRTYRDGRGDRVETCHQWALGGVGYFLSRKAAVLLAGEEPGHWAEDLWVGQVLCPLIPAGTIKAFAIPKFENNISWHFPKKAYGRRSYDPSFGWMEKMYRKTRQPSMPRRCLRSLHRLFQ